MGRVLYGKAQFEISDRDAAYLDAVVAEACRDGVTFRFHFTVGGDGDRRIASVTLGAGCPVLIEYPNADLGIEWGYVVAAMADIREKGTLSVGFFSAL